MKHERNFLPITVAPAARHSCCLTARRKLDFVYDWQGRRVQKIVATNNGTSYVAQSTNRFLYDGWNLVAVLNQTNGLLYSFRWGSDLSGTMQGAGGVGGLVSMTVHTGTNAGTYFYGYDGNGNVTALVNATNGAVAAQYEYGPFGEVLRATGPVALANPFRFSTKYQDDETGLNYYGYRFYNPSGGRWLSRDPIGEIAEHNLYGFIGNDSINWVDMLGLFKSKYHRSISETALKNSGLGKKCIDTIAQANIDQDDGALSNSGPFADSLNHGDNNQIKPTIDRIKERLDEITKKQCLNCDDLNDLLKIFGKTAHALQDLYAHSTYVENLGKDAKKPEDVPIWQFWNADGSVNVPIGVISGAYKWPRDNAPSPSHSEFNKDEPNSEQGKRKNNNGLTWFALAEDTATRHTTAIWNDAVSKLTPEQKKKLAECCKK